MRSRAVIGALALGSVMLVLAAAAPGSRADTWDLPDGRSWEKVPVAGATCGNGEDDLHLFFSEGDEGSNRVVLWFPGGGSTYTDLDGELKGPIHSLLQVRRKLRARQNAPTRAGLEAAFPFIEHNANEPFIAEAHWVYLPYCTQDRHAGGRTSATRYDFKARLRDDITAAICDKKKKRRRTPEWLEANFPGLELIDVGNSKSCPDPVGAEGQVFVDIMHRGGRNFQRAQPVIRQELADRGVDLLELEIMVAGSSAGGYGAWYNAWRFGDDIYDRPEASLTIVPMAGSPTVAVWDNGQHALRERDRKVDGLVNRLTQHQVVLPCDKSGGAYVLDPNDRCLDVLKLIDHYQERYPDLDLRMIPVVNKEDALGIRGFQAQFGQAEGLLKFCQTNHAYGYRMAQRERAHPWLSWLYWRESPASTEPKRRLHGFIRAAWLVPLLAPDGGVGAEPGDGLHGVLAYMNAVADGDFGHFDPDVPMIDHELGLIDDVSDPESGFFPGFLGQWDDLNIEPADCIV